jgi:hypothetical protein
MNAGGWERDSNPSPIKTTARECILAEKAGRVRYSRPVMVGAEGIETVTRDGLPPHGNAGASYTRQTFGAERLFVNSQRKDF